MRQVVSYDDITPPEDSTPAQLGPPLPSTNQPPAKKRKMHQKAPAKRSQQHMQHWDEPGSSADVMNYQDDQGYEVEQNPTLGGVSAEEEEEESRDLTHEEIWDDSALIDAWNSANAEYEAYHGKDKKWKTEPVKKSPLWYNIPPSPTKSKKKESVAHQGSTHGTGQLNGNAEADSAPLNFDTYVPTYDPSLASAAPPHPPGIPGADYSQYYLPEPPGPMVSQDEAFTRALSAMYWGGYWTAVYHCQRNANSADGPEQEEEEEGADDAMDDDMVSTQR